MHALALALALASRAGAPSPIDAAVAAALALPGARAEVVEVQGSLPVFCAVRRAEVPRPVAASGRVAVHLIGETAGCDAWAWATVRVMAPLLVTTRAVPAGAPLAGAAEPRDREVVAGRPMLGELPDGAVAETHLAAGTVLGPAAVRVGPRPGEPVTVALRVGALTVEQPGRAIACQRGRACALLPSGRRAEGRWHAGRIELETP